MSKEEQRQGLKLGDQKKDKRVQKIAQFPVCLQPFKREAGPRNGPASVGNEHFSEKQYASELTNLVTSGKSLHLPASWLFLICTTGKSVVPNV